MSHAKATIYTLLATGVLFFLIVSSESKSNLQGLHLQSHSEQNVVACYNYNNTFGICFDVGKDFMKVLKTTGEQIVFYQEIGSNMFYYEVVGRGFIGHDASMIYVPDNIPRIPHELRGILAMNQIPDQEPSVALKAFKNNYQETFKELSSVPEIQLLELVSVALSGNYNSAKLNILKPFHALCFNLLQSSNIQPPTELTAAHDLDDDTADQPRMKRCSLAADPHNNSCTGMCGPSCRCWSWICGDCCWHQGCFNHDMCCEKNPWSAYCLVPFFYGFSCGSYMTC